MSNLPTACTPTATRIEWSDLIAVNKKDGSGTLHPVTIITAHTMPQCVNFAHVLLNDRIAVQRIQNDNKEVDPFVQAVLSKWLASEGAPAVQCTWSGLLDCMSKAGMDGFSIKEMRDNLL